MTTSAKTKAKQFTDKLLKERLIVGDCEYSFVENFMLSKLKQHERDIRNTAMESVHSIGDYEIPVSNGYFLENSSCVLLDEVESVIRNLEVCDE